MGDLSFSYLCITSGNRTPCHDGSSTASINGALSQWMSNAPPSLKELPLLGQLSMPSFLPYTALDNDDAMTASEYLYSTEDKLHLPNHELSELPLLWQPAPSLNHTENKEEESLNSSIWTRLPLDIIERVISFLPVPDAVRLSAVSKQWNSITFKVFSKSYNGGSSLLVFQSEQGSSKLQKPWLAAYDLCAKKWYCFSLDFLPDPPTAPFMNYTVVSASGGLLCLWPEPAKTWKSVGLVVCNPVTRHWRELPCRSQDNQLPDIVVMSVDNKNCNYKILVLTEAILDSRGFVVTELYDSKSCKWTFTGVRPTFGGKFKSSVVSRGKVYFVYEEAPRRYKIRVFDMDKQQWRTSLSMPMFFEDMPEVIGNLQILVCNGSVLLVGRAGKHCLKEEVIIWELDPSVNQVDSWREVDRMPEDIAREFLGCLVFGHYYCLSNSDQVFFIASFKAPMLVYSQAKRSWSWRSWPFYEKYENRFPVFGFVKVPVCFPPFGFAFDLRFDAII